MSGHTGRYAAAWRRLAARWKRCWRLCVPAALAVMLQACASSPPAPISHRDPSDADALAAAVRYRSTIGPYESRRPVDPGPAMMTGFGQFTPIEMGGMFTIVKIREGLTPGDYGDPGAYKHPAGTVAYEIETASAPAPRRSGH